jgi:hypothetical protein
MKRKKTIVIKNPFLRNLRNNLRRILVRAIWREVKRLKQIEKAFEEKYDDPFEIDEYWENRAHVILHPYHHANPRRHAHGIGFP